MIMMHARPADLSLQAMTVHVLLAKSLRNVFCFIGEIKITQTTEQNHCNRSPSDKETVPFIMS